jgi:hypothetical protein
MPIHFTCTVCANPVSAPDQATGKVGKCPKCKALVSVPETSDRPPPTPVGARRNRVAVAMAVSAGVALALGACAVTGTRALQSWYLDWLARRQQEIAEREAARKVEADQRERERVRLELEASIRLQEMIHRGEEEARERGRSRGGHGVMGGGMTEEQADRAEMERRMETLERRQRDAERAARGYR